MLKTTKNDNETVSAYVDYSDADSGQDAGLPEDYPAASTLEEAGYTSTDEVDAASDEELLAIDGIGEATLKEIRSY